MKLLPGTAPGGAIVKSTAKISADKVTPGKGKAFVIKRKLISIDNLLKSSLTEKKKEEKEKVKLLERQKRDKRETKLETQTKEEKDTKKKLALPKLPFLERVKKFFLNILSGFVLVRLIDHADKILPMLPFIGKTLDTMVDLTIGFIDGLGGFLAGAYDLYDGLKGQIEDRFGEDGVKKFEELSGALNKFFDIAILAGFAAAISGRGGEKPRRPRGKPGRDGRTATQRLRDLRRRRFGQRLFAGANRLTFGLLGRATDFAQNVGQSLKSKYDSVTKSIGGAFNKLGNAAKEQFVKRILDPAMVFLNPILDKVKGIGSKILKQIEKIPGFGRVVDFLKKQGITNLGDAGKLAKKLGGKAIPILGGILNFLFAYDRLAQGDTIGGLLEAISGAFDVSGLFGFVPGPGISMGIDAYMFARDMIPGIQQGEESIINSLGLGGLKGDIDNMFSKLPDLSTIVKRLTGSPEDQSLMETAFGSKPTTSTASKINVGGNNIVSIGKDLGSKGFAIAEHPDFTKTKSGGRYTPGEGSVSNVHSGAGHYENRAIDVTDWRGSLEDSKGRYRSVLSSLQDNPNIKMLIHDSWGFYKDGKKSGPGNYSHPTHMHIETKDEGGMIGKGMFMNKGRPEFVIDANSTRALEDNFPGFLAALNHADYNGAIGVLRNYASYEAAGGARFIPVPIPVKVPTETSSQMSSSINISGGAQSDPMMEKVYAGG
jgi:hypothetical protein